MSRSALFVRWVLGLGAVIFFVLGILFIFNPAMMIGAMDIKAEPGKALADIRAIYGGLDLALGILLGVYFFRKDWVSGLGISTLACACIFTGRLVGILVDPARDILTFGLFASEVAGALLSAVALLLARRETVTTTAPYTTPPADSTPGVSQA